MALQNTDIEEIKKIISEQHGEEIYRRLGRSNKIQLTTVIAIASMAISGVWWASQMDSRVAQDHEAIKQIQNEQSIFLNKEDLTNLLALRDQQIKTLELSLSRIEAKLDKLAK